MTFQEYKSLPQDIQQLISESCYAFDIDPETPEGITRPMSFTQFIEYIEYRSDSGLMYSEPIAKYNPHDVEEEKASPGGFETGLTYNAFENEALPSGLYLGLFHGREKEDEKLYDWGFNGPVIGPLKWVHTTYQNHIRFCPVGEEDGIDLRFAGDLLEWNGKFYGDFTVFNHQNPKDDYQTALRILGETVKRYEAGKEKLLVALKDLQKEVRENVRFDVKKNYSLMVADVSATKVIVEAENRVLFMHHTQEPEQVACTDAMGLQLTITEKDYPAIETAGLDLTKEEDLFAYANHLLGGRFTTFVWTHQ